jgi:hypothetical protein
MKKPVDEWQNKGNSAHFTLSHSPVQKLQLKLCIF